MFESTRQFVEKTSRLEEGQAHHSQNHPVPAGADETCVDHSAPAVTTLQTTRRTQTHSSDPQPAGVQSGLGVSLEQVSGTAAAKGQGRSNAESPRESGAIRTNVLNLPVDAGSAVKSSTPRADVQDRPSTEPVHSSWMPRTCTPGGLYTGPANESGMPSTGPSDGQYNKPGNRGVMLRTDESRMPHAGSVTTYGLPSFSEPCGAAGSSNSLHTLSLHTTGAGPFPVFGNTSFAMAGLRSDLYTHSWPLLPYATGDCHAYQANLWASRNASCTLSEVSRETRTYGHDEATVHNSSRQGPVHKDTIHRQQTPESKSPRRLQQKHEPLDFSPRISETTCTESGNKASDEIHHSNQPLDLRVKALRNKNTQRTQQQDSDAFEQNARTDSENKEEERAQDKHTDPSDNQERENRSTTVAKDSKKVGDTHRKRGAGVPRFCASSPQKTCPSAIICQQSGDVKSVLTPANSQSPSSIQRVVRTPEHHKMPAVASVHAPLPVVPYSWMTQPYPHVPDIRSGATSSRNLYRPIPRYALPLPSYYPTPYLTLPSVMPAVSGPPLGSPWGGLGRWDIPDPLLGSRPASAPVTLEVPGSRSSGRRGRGGSNSSGVSNSRKRGRAVGSPVSSASPPKRQAKE